MRRVPVGHGHTLRLLTGTGCLLRLAQRLNSQLKLLQAENGMAKKAVAEDLEPWGGWYPSAWLFGHIWVLDCSSFEQSHAVACSGGGSGNVFVALVSGLWGLLAAVSCWVQAPL